MRGTSGGGQDVVGWSLSSRNGWIEEKVVLFRARGIDFKSKVKLSFPLLSVSMMGMDGLWSGSIRMFLGWR
jgi:hypothetical protein